MDRRRYLAVAATALIAGCNEAGESGESPAKTPTATPTATASPSDPSPQGQTATETQTETEPPAETDTPTRRERARTAFTDAQRAVARAHAAYLAHVDGAETIADVGPFVTGFDADDVAGEIEQALSHLDTADEYARNDLDGHVLELRRSARWLRATAQLQEAMGTVSAHLEDGRSAIAGEDPGLTFENYDGVVEAIDATIAAIEDVSETSTGRGDPSRLALSAIDGIDYDAAQTKVSRMNRVVVAVEALTQPLERVRRTTRRLEAAATMLEADADNADDAADEAEKAAEFLRDAAASVADRNNPDSFAPVAGTFAALVDALVAQAEAVERAADDQ